MQRHKEQQEITEQIREIINTKGLKYAIKAVEAMIAEAKGYLKNWLKGVLRYMKMIKALIEEEKERNNLFSEEVEKKIYEALEREADIAKLWTNLSDGLWSAVDSSWQDVVINAVENVISEISFSSVRQKGGA